MNRVEVQTPMLRLVSRTIGEALAQVERMTAEQKAELSSEWLAQLHSSTVDTWTLGFDLVDRTTGGR